jgi:hypothetical protein
MLVQHGKPSMEATASTDRPEIEETMILNEPGANDLFWNADGNAPFWSRNPKQLFWHAQR